MRFRKGIPAESGVASSVHYGGGASSGSCVWKGAIYNSSLSLLSPQTAQGTMNSATIQWWQADITSGPEVTGSSIYYVASLVDGNVGLIAYDSGGVSGESKYLWGETYPNFPASPSPNNSSSKYSIYCTYTAGEEEERRIINIQ